MMNVGFYDMEKGKLRRAFQSADMTPDDLRQMSLMIQLDAQEQGEQLSGILVGWQPYSTYIGVFLLGDMADKSLSEKVLNRIERQARSH